MVWNTIAHPRMMAAPHQPGSEVNATPMPLQYVSTGKQNVYDLILSDNPLAGSDEAPAIAYGDYDDLCAKLIRGELILCTLVTLMKTDNGGIRQDYSVFPACKSISMVTERTIHGKPVIFVVFDGNNAAKFIIDCDNAIYAFANAPFDPTEPDVD